MCALCTYVTFWPLDAGMLVVTEEESFSAATFIAAHHVDADLLASAVPLRTLVYICKERNVRDAVTMTSGSNKTYAECCWPESGKLLVNRNHNKQVFEHREI